MNRRALGAKRNGAAAILTALALLTVSACGGSSSASGQNDGEGDNGSGDGSAVSIQIAPDDGADGVATSGELAVSAEGGELTDVQVTDPEGEEVAGEFGEDNTAWTPVDHLAPDTTYTVTATGEGGGDEVTETASFATVVPDATVETQTPLWNWVDEGDTVGVGTVITVNFDVPVENREAVEEAIEIVTEPEVEVTGHWFNAQRVDFRPEEYWEPGTEITVKFRTRGVEVAPGVYGTRHNDRHLTVGHRQISTVDADSLTMTVERDGDVLEEIPITAGAPGKDTWNGKMVVSEMYDELRMDGATVGYDYDIPDVPHAMRLSTSGTFLHGNYWSSPSTFGSRLDTHGCIGLEDVQGRGDDSTPGAWFYENTQIGDIVEVINSDDDIIAPDNGINGWNMDWSEWGAGPGAA